MRGAEDEAGTEADGLWAASADVEAWKAVGAGAIRPIPLPPPPPAHLSSSEPESGRPVPAGGCSQKRRRSQCRGRSLRGRVALVPPFSGPRTAGRPLSGSSPRGLLPESPAEVFETFFNFRK